MSRTVINVEKLGKEYVIGGRENDADTFREMIVSAATSPFRRLKRLRGEVIPEERIWALNDVSFAVKEGEVLGIVGRNGAGKSTLLKILSRITAPTKGRVKIRGRVASLLEVGTGFHPELTGRENIYLNGAILGMSRAEIARKFDEIVEFSGVEKFLDTPVKRYSSGMYVRLAFAVAAHLEPEVLIVDEVLAVGDAQFQRRCLGKMSSVAHEGRTVIFVSHNTTALQELCHSAIWIEQGVIKELGAASSVLPSYVMDGSGFSGSDVSLLNVSRSSNLSKAYVKLCKLAFSSPLPLRYGEEVLGYLTLSIIKPVEALAVAIGFSTLDGKRLLTYDSDLQANGLFSSATAGAYNAYFKIDRLPLPPDVYAIDVGCRLGRASCDYVPRAIVTDVISGDTAPAFLRQRHDPSVRLASEWRLTELTSD